MEFNHTVASQGATGTLGGAEPPCGPLRPEQVSAYLHRLRYDGPVGVCAETLASLIPAHLQAVPFENLDILDSRPIPSLLLEDLFDKIVVRGRGGYCFELNTLFCALLQSLGFSVYPVAGRVVWRRDYTPPLSHRATVVRLPDGLWFCDVGFGGPGPKGPLCLTDAAPQTVAGDQFCLGPRGAELCICRQEQGDWAPVLSFRNEPYELADFPLIHEHFSQSPESRFTQYRIVNLCTPDGHMALTGNELTICRSGESTTELLSDEAVPAALARYFGL